MLCSKHSAQSPFVVIANTLIDLVAFQMSEVTKDKDLNDQAKANAVILNNKAVSGVTLDAVQEKNIRNSALVQQQQQQQNAGSAGSERAPLARVSAPRDYSSSGDTSPTRRYSAHSLSPSSTGGDDTLRRRKSTDCGLSSSSSNLRGAIREEQSGANERARDE